MPRPENLFTYQTKRIPPELSMVEVKLPQKGDGLFRSLLSDFLPLARWVNCVHR
jgi:hypothetical protein